MPPVQDLSKRNILIRKEVDTDPSLGCAPNKRPIKDVLCYGVVNVDKPKGPTSHQVSDYVKRILHVPKAGHSGTLDPAVTGVLAIACDKATRVVQALLSAGKEYVGVMHIHQDVGEEKIREACSEFVGTIDQLPPIKSSVKRQLRKRTIYYLELLEIDGQDVLFKVGCQAGTYIRKLCHDVGEKLGCGAHMAQLRRTWAGPFNEQTSVTLQTLTDAYHYYTQGDESKLRSMIHPMEDAVAHLPKVWVFDETIPSICSGVDLKVPGISKVHEGISMNDMIAVMSLKGELVALGTAKMQSTSMVKDTGLAVGTDKVFMDRSVYLKEKSKNSEKKE